MNANAKLSSAGGLEPSRPLTRLTGAQAFAACLAEEGVEFVFSVPGGQTLSILDALYDHPEIKVITARHECAAACMADVYGRLTGKPAVVMSTTGPGATNLPTGVGNAHRDSTPMIVVTVNNNRREIGHDEAQDADHNQLMRQFVKSTRFVPDPENVVIAAREAFRFAMSGNTGPAHIDFARDAVEKGEIDFEALGKRTSRAALPAVAHPSAIAAAAARIRKAEKPVIWAGRGVINANAGEALVEFAETIGAAVVTTYNGISAFPGRHPLSIGARSKWGGRVPNKVFAESDLVILIGNSMNSITTSRWTLKLPDVIQIDCDPLSVGKRYPVEVGVLGDAREALASLTAELRRDGVADRDRKTWFASIDAERERWKAACFRDEYETATPVKPQQVMRALSEQFDDDTVFVFDAGNAGIWSHMVPVQKARNYIKPVGFGAMAFALPGAIGGKLTRPDSTIVSIIGDGSMAMSLGELETAIREKLPMVIIVFNDLGYGNIKQLQSKMYGQRFIGVDLGDTHFHEVSRAMGGDGERVTHGSDLADAIERAKGSSVPYVIDVMIDATESIWDDPF